MAKKPTVTTISSGYASNTQLNANFVALRDGFDNTLSLDGSTPNSMGADLDMNSKDIINAATINTSILKINGTVVTVSNAVDAHTEYRYAFKTVADLLADTRTLTNYYTIGDYVLAGGFSYEVVASGGDLVTAGGIQLDVLAGADGYVYPDQFAVNTTPGTTDMTAAVNSAIATGSAALLATTYGVTNVVVQTDGASLVGKGWASVIRRLVGTTGDTVYVASTDPTAATVQGVTLDSFRIDCGFEFTSGSQLHIAECANSNFKNLFVLNGFQGMRVRGLRAATISNIQIAQGATYSALLVGSRGMLWEDSPRIGTAYENVEVFCNNINVRQNNSGDAKCEYGIEIKNADGIWFDNSHFRCGFYAQAWLNAQDTDNMALCMFSNTLFDGNTQRNLLVSGDGGTKSTLHNFTGCKFLSAVISCVEIVAGSRVGTMTFDSPVFGYNGNGVDNSVVFRIDAGDDIQVDNPQGDTIELLTGLSVISVGSGVVNASITGGRVEVTAAPAAEYYGVSVLGSTTRVSVQGVDFIGFTQVLSVPIKLTDPRVVPFRGGNCTTDHPTKYVAGTTTEYYIAGIPNNGFDTIELGEIIGGRLEFELEFSSAGFGSAFLETAGGTTVIVAGSVATVAAGTAPLTGTSGTVGNLTIALDSNGTLYVENRTSVTRNISLSLRRSIASQTITDG